jgi:hypothetical protein
MHRMRSFSHQALGGSISMLDDGMHVARLIALCDGLEPFKAPREPVAVGTVLDAAR